MIVIFYFFFSNHYTIGTMFSQQNIEKDTMYVYLIVISLYLGKDILTTTSFLINKQ